MGKHREEKQKRRTPTDGATGMVPAFMPGFMMGVLPIHPMAHQWAGLHTFTHGPKMLKKKKKEKKRKRRKDSSSESSSADKAPKGDETKPTATVPAEAARPRKNTEAEEVSALDLLIRESEQPAQTEKRPRRGWDEASKKEKEEAAVAKGDAAAAAAPEKSEADESLLSEEPRSVTGLKLIGEEAPETLPWQYVLKDEQRRSFVGFLPRTLSQDVCSSFFLKAFEGANWLQPMGPNGPIPRKTAWMVFFDCSCTYRYGRIEVEPQQYPPWMCTLMHWVMPCCGINEQKDWPNSCNLNLYEDGSTSVGWHADDEQLFQGKARDCRIISLSLGATRNFELRKNWSDEDTVRLRLSDGDLCTMEGLAQKHLQHRVPREDQVKGPRINLTWRWIVKHSLGCPAR